MVMMLLRHNAVAANTWRPNDVTDKLVSSIVRQSPTAAALDNENDHYSYTLHYQIVDDTNLSVTSFGRHVFAATAL